MTTTPSPLLTPERIKFKKKIESQKCAFDTLTELLVKGQNEISKNEVFDALIDREKLGTTYIGNGISIPRARVAITHPRAAILALKQGLKSNSVDKQAINFYLAILLPSESSEDYSDKLKALNKNLLIEDNLNNILSTKNPDRLIEYIENILDNKGSN